MSWAPAIDADALVPVRPVVFARRLAAEAFGTFALVFVDCGGAVIAALDGPGVTPAARSAATGLMVMVLSFTMADVSGAHFNPAISLAFALRRVFPWRSMAAYWVAQLAGALLASVLLRALFGDVAQLGTAVPRYGVERAFVFELLLTLFRVVVTLGTATRHRVLGADAAIASGGVVALCGLFARPVSGAAANPARALAPAIVAGAMANQWLYVVAPLAGAILATGVMAVVHHRRHAEEPQAAGGEPKQ